MHNYIFENEFPLIEISIIDTASSLITCEIFCWHGKHISNQTNQQDRQSTAQFCNISRFLEAKGFGEMFILRT